ncbi:LRP2-like protein [Mya arenaria]|uniref:LRP2-like protein n=1 Tax=Mya arenaria TaxID=6604 RepID=A0ABY7DDE2_MYAAR|nr:LRP2-like protein [Mya arenaria]
MPYHPSNAIPLTPTPFHLSQWHTILSNTTAACVGQFYCKNTQSSSGISWMQPSSQPECVNKMKICDGMMDCSNGADEKGCPAECKCGERSYLCMGKGKCINIKQVCDGDNDCPMNEDETCLLHTIHKS